MKLAITGKGGVGKTTVAASLARLLSRDGMSVVAVDADPNPTLGLAIGLSDHDLQSLEGIANRLIADRNAHDHDHPQGQHTPTCDPGADTSADDLVARMGVDAPDGVRLVQTGTIERPSEGCLCCGSHSTTRRIFEGIGADGRIVIADLEAGLNDLIWTRPTEQDAVAVVSAPYVKSLEVARRAVKICTDLGVTRIIGVANRATSADDVDRVREVVGGRPVIAIPDDEAVVQAERDGVALLDAAPDSAAAQAIGELAEMVRGW